MIKNSFFLEFAFFKNYSNEEYVFIIEKNLFRQQKKELTFTRSNSLFFLCIQSRLNKDLFHALNVTTIDILSPIYVLLCTMCVLSGFLILST